MYQRTIRIKRLRIVSNAFQKAGIPYGKEEFEDFAHMIWCEEVPEKERAIQSLEVLYITDSYAVFMVVPDYDSSMHVICSILSGRCIKP